MTIIKSLFYYLIYTTIVFVVCKPTVVLSQQSTIKKYNLIINYVGKDSTFNAQHLKLQTTFSNQIQCVTYINQLPTLLQLKGYAAASIDSVFYDTIFARIEVYLGNQQQLVQLSTDSIDKKAISTSVYNSKNLINKPLNMAQLQILKEHILNYYLNNGYPFAAVFLDSIQLSDTTMNAAIKVTKGPLYHIDSIRIKGNVKISNSFLQRYLSISNGSIYNQAKLEAVSKRLLDLPYLQEQQPAELMMLGTGSILDVYLLPKKSSQVNFLVGFLPASSQNSKLRLTGDVNLNLKNALSNGETIIVNWQQLQVSSPRINLAYQQPYIFKSAFGVDFAFDLFKKDSTFLQINAQLGIQYLLSANQSGKIFFQNSNSFLLGSGVDTNMVKVTRKLPVNVDVKAVNVGVDYELNTTNYRFNPKSGNEFKIIGAVGIKTITRNNEIIGLKDPAFNYASLYDSVKLKSYQIRLKITAAHYFPVGKRSTLKTVFNGGLFNSASIFRNELFQIGGFKLLRGFNEESIYATRYGVFTAEFRNLISLNSYLFTFIDAGWVNNNYQAVNINNQFTSAGLGLLFETKAGLLNISFAVGKRNDTKFSLREASKIHFGYINYF